MKLYHGSGWVKNFEVGEIVTFDFSKGIYGEGLYFSNKVEPEYLSGSLFIIDKQKYMKLVSKTDESKWYVSSKRTYFVKNIIYYDRYDFCLKYNVFEYALNSNLKTVPVIELQSF